MNPFGVRKKSVVYQILQTGVRETDKFAEEIKPHHLKNSNDGKN